MELADLDPDPIVAFTRWHAEAGTDAMTVATVDAAGSPSARIVLLKGADQRGFAFHTNYESDKARDLDATGRTALVFHFPPDRQVRVTGRVSRLSADENDAYWATRPRGSQLGAWASAQSRIIESRERLEAALADVTARFAGRDVPRPPFWGGYLVAPETIEFWHHREDRLHDRIRFRRAGEDWVAERLSP